MPTISEAVQAAQQLPDSYEPVEPTPVQAHSMPTPEIESIQRDIFLRCPLPTIASSPDSLRQFYRNSIPQTRVTPLFAN